MSVYRCGLILAALLLSARAYAMPDKYPDFLYMALQHDTTKEYTITVRDRLSEVTILTPHGEHIENGTSDLGEELSGTDWNYYSFNSISGSPSKDLHITSTRYNDPIAVSLASSSLVAITLHRQKEQTMTICLGGRNKELREAVRSALDKAGFSCESRCMRLSGNHCTNIVNRAKLGGLQIELSQRIADKLDSDKKLRASFLKALRDSISASLPLMRRKATENRPETPCAIWTPPSAGFEH